MVIVPLSAANHVHSVCDSIHTLRTVMPKAGFGVPADAVADPEVARYVADHGVTVFADDEEDLELVRLGHIRPVQVVLSCTGGMNRIRRAISMGVNRFATRNEDDMRMLSSCAHRPAYVYLDADQRIPEPRRRLEVVGLRREVDAGGDSTMWAAEVDRMLCRLALLNRCGMHPRRLSVVDKSETADFEVELIVAQINDAIRTGCERWRLRVPTVTFVPAVAVPRPAVAAA